MRRCVVLGVLLAMVCACGGGPADRLRDRGPVEDEDVPVAPDADATFPDVPGVPQPAATFVSPADGSYRTDLPTVLDVTIALDDPAGVGFASLTLESARLPKAVVTAAPADLASGTWTGTFQCAGEGEETLTVEAITTDGRTATATTTFVIDPGKPVIEETILHPADAFTGTVLQMGYTFRDAVSGIAWAEVQVDGKPVWTVAPSRPYPDEVVADDGTGAITVDATGWDRRQVSVTVRARDAAGNEATTAWTSEYLPAARFAGTGGIPVPDDGTHFLPFRVEGIRVGEDRQVVLMSEQEVRRYAIDPVSWPPRLVKTWEWPLAVRGSPGVDVEVADLDLDGREDLVVLAAWGVWLLRQNEDGGFEERALSGKPDMKFPFSALAIGRINDDPYPDVATAVNTSGPSLDLLLSRAEGSSVTWDETPLFGGVPNPDLVAVGRLTSASGKRNDVLLGKRNSNVMTVFEVDEATGIPFGGLTQVLKVDDVPISRLLAIGAFQASADRKAALVYTDANTDTLSCGTLEPGGLGAVRTQKTGLYPDRFVAADMAGDGRPQLLATARDSQMFLRFVPGADGHPVKVPVSLPVAGAPIDLAARDLLEDDVLDALVLVDTTQKNPKHHNSPSGRKVVVLPFHREPGGGASPSYPLGMVDLRDYEVQAIAAGEFLGKARDGRKELAIAAKPRWDNRTVLMLLAPDENGDPTVVLDPVPVAIPTTTTLLVGDVDGQGLDDLVFLTAATNKDCMHVLLFQPSDDARAPVFLEPPVPDPCILGTGERLGILADLDAPENGQGTPDLAVLGFRQTNPNLPPEPRLITAFGQGDGTFLAGADTAVSPDRRATAITSAPFQGRSRWPDVAVCFGPSSDFTTIFQEPDGGGTFQVPTEFVAVGLNPRSIAAGRLNDDEYPDVATLLQNDAVLSYATVDAGRLRYTTSWYLQVGGKSLSAVAVGDVNGDGKPDVAVVDAEWSNVAFYLNVGPKRFEPAIDVVDTGMGPTGLVLEDLGGDGKLDVVTLDKLGHSVSFFRNLMSY